MKLRMIETLVKDMVKGTIQHLRMIGCMQLSFQRLEICKKVVICDIAFYADDKTFDSKCDLAYMICDNN